MENGNNIGKILAKCMSIVKKTYLMEAIQYNGFNYLKMRNLFSKLKPFSNFTRCVFYVTLLMSDASSLYVIRAALAWHLGIVPGCKIL